MSKKKKSQNSGLDNPYPLTLAQIEGLKKIAFGELFEKFYRIEVQEVEKYVKLGRTIIFLTTSGQSHIVTQRQLRGKYFVIEES